MNVHLLNLENSDARYCYCIDNLAVIQVCSLRETF